MRLRRRTWEEIDKSYISYQGTLLLYYIIHLQGLTYYLITVIIILSFPSLVTYDFLNLIYDLNTVTLVTIVKT